MTGSGWALARPTWSSPPHPPAEGFAAFHGHYCPSPVLQGNSLLSPGGAGLTSKPHRDQSTRSRLTWAVSPAAGIGLPDWPSGRQRGYEDPPRATTDPGECHG